MDVDIPSLLDVCAYGDRLLIVFDKGEMCRFRVKSHCVSAMSKLKNMSKT